MLRRHIRPTDHLAKIIQACLRVITILLAFAPTWCVAAYNPTGGTASTLIPERATETLRAGLESDEPWARVHAAEALIRLDYRQGVPELIGRELGSHGDEPSYRIGLWRVMAALATDDSDRGRWIDKVRSVAGDPAASDRVNAIETLGKLGYVATEREARELKTLSREADGIIIAMSNWVLANIPSGAGDTALAQLLEEDDPQIRLGAAYALRYLGSLSPEAWRMLTDAADREPADSPARVFLLSAILCHAPDIEVGAVKDSLLQYIDSADKDARYELCEALAQRGNDSDLTLLSQLLQDDNGDVRIAAANAILRIGRRNTAHIAGPDWLVIIAYLTGMLLVGWYYARRSSDTEDYLLGGRNMRPWTVGLSLFATLLSTLSYLFIPGEMIKYGPMILTQLAAYPLIVLIVGWFLIPQFMKLRVTTAYEILETRLGSSVRLLGSVIFLLLRLLWMAVIIYATTDKVLVPMSGLDPEATPWVCAVLGVITVAYTSMGGLRAVVLTDVVQTFILFGGAVLAIATITISLGGFGAWWPRSWSPDWPEPNWFNLDARVSFLGASIGVFFWWICTAGSDQMAIQRYLATRDVKAARRAFVIAMICDAGVCLFLAALGFALLAYFQANPHMVPDGETIHSGADKLFPRYIVFGLPVGVSGLIVAGLLAAAMSSLSSGINSCCSVITVDFVDRFRKASLTSTGHIKLARAISVAVGAVVVALSLYVSIVPGNLLEVVYKVVNLFTGPLFVLFFVAMFIPWRTVFGAWMAALVSAAVAITIAYWELLTGDPGPSFLWITPASLATGIVTAAIASLLPIGRRTAASPN